MTNRILITMTAIAAAALAPTGSASAAVGCVTVDYQGAPAEVCPEQVPDLTNCYWGDYQGAPIEVCLPTGDKLPEGTTIGGLPPVYHTSAAYVPLAVAPEPAPAPEPEVAPIPVWVADYVALLGF